MNILLIACLAAGAPMGVCQAEAAAGTTLADFPPQPPEWATEAWQDFAAHIVASEARMYMSVISLRASWPCTNTKSVVQWSLEVLYDEQKTNLENSNMSRLWGASRSPEQDGILQGLLSEASSAQSLCGLRARVPAGLKQSDSLPGLSALPGVWGKDNPGRELLSALRGEARWPGGSPEVNNLRAPGLSSLRKDISACRSASRVVPRLPEAIERRGPLRRRVHTRGLCRAGAPPGVYLRNLRYPDEDKGFVKGPHHSPLTGRGDGYIQYPGRTPRLQSCETRPVHGCAPFSGTRNMPAPSWATPAWREWAAHVVSSEAANVPAADIVVMCTMLRDVERGWLPWGLGKRWFGCGRPDAADRQAVRDALVTNACDAVPDYKFVGNIRDVQHWRAVGMIGEGPFDLYVGATGSTVVGVQW